MLGLWEIIGTITVIILVFTLGNKAPHIARVLGRGLEYIKTIFFGIPKDLKKDIEDIKKTVKEDKK